MRFAILGDILTKLVVTGRLTYFISRKDKRMENRHVSHVLHGIGVVFLESIQIIHNNWRFPGHLHQVLE